MRSLELRLKRLEQRAKAKNTRTPTRTEFDGAAFRQRTRNTYSGRLKLHQIAGRDEEELLRSFAPKDRAFLEADTSEQHQKDADVEERWRRVHGLGGEEISGVAARVRQKLRAMKRTEVRDNLMGRG